MLEDLDHVDEAKRIDAAAALDPAPGSATEKCLLEACVIDDAERAREAFFEALLRGRKIHADLFSLVDVCGHTMVASPLRSVRALGARTFANVLAGMDSGRTAEEIGATQDFAGVSRKTGAGDPMARRFLRSMAEVVVREPYRDGYDLAAFASLGGIARTWAELGILERLAKDVRAVRALGTIRSTRAIATLRELLDAELLPAHEVAAALASLGAEARAPEPRLAAIEVDGITIGGDVCWVDLVRRALSDRRGAHPMSRAGIDGLFRLYDALASGSPRRRYEHEEHASRLARAIAGLLDDPDVRTRSEALVFFGRHPLAPGAERVYEILDRHRDLFFREDLGPNLMWILRARALAGKAPAIERMKAEIDRSDLPGELRAILAETT